ncbi:MAG: DUF1059 domain-containing protein [Nitrospiraceae bacterium]|nr:MAG: DUF1059 domain-containing protein [Nitrospiraceae bacterium]
MGKIFYCKDLGSDCDWKGAAYTEDELFRKVVEHAAERHDIKDMLEEQKKRIRELIKDDSSVKENIAAR